MLVIKLIPAIHVKILYSKMVDWCNNTLNWLQKLEGFEAWYLELLSTSLLTKIFHLPLEMWVAKTSMEIMILKKLCFFFFGCCCYYQLIFCSMYEFLYIPSNWFERESKIYLLTHFIKEFHKEIWGKNFNLTFLYLLIFGSCIWFGFQIKNVVNSADLPPSIIVSAPLSF